MDVLIDGTSRAAIEACLFHDRAGRPGFGTRFGRFGFLLSEISKRCGAEVITLDAEWGTVFEPDQIADALKTHAPKYVRWFMVILRRPWLSHWMK